MALCNGVVIGDLLSKQRISCQLHPSAVRIGRARKYVVQAVQLLPPTPYRHNHSSDPSITISSDLKSKFMQVYDSLKSDIFDDPSFEFDDDSRRWVDKMIDYNVPGGKFHRALTAVEAYKLLKGEELTDDELFLTCALGWCMEWLQASILILDDVIDDSHLRRGQPCWFKVPEVGLVAVNDARLLRNHTAIILKKHFKEKAYYVDLLDLFNEVEYQTFSGQMIDMISTLGEKNLSKFSLSTNLRILQYKSAYCTTYIPVACALIMAGENLDDHALVKDVLIKMGTYFSVQDDYLDTYGDPKVTGKIGLDIENFKCSWLVAKALELANEEQKKILNENYGVKDPAKIAKVKEIYHALNLKGVYEDYENKTYEELMKSIETHPDSAVQAVLKSSLGKIYKRQK